MGPVSKIILGISLLIPVLGIGGCTVLVFTTRPPDGDWGLPGVITGIPFFVLSIAVSSFLQFLVLSWFMLSSLRKGGIGNILTALAFFATATILGLLAVDYLETRWNSLPEESSPQSFLQKLGVVLFD